MTIGQKPPREQLIHIAAAIERFTPVNPPLLRDNDLWRATHPLQLDEIITVYCSKLLEYPTPLLLLNNRHPMVPISTLRVGHRLVQHGLSTQMLHYWRVQMKRRVADVGPPSMP